MIISRHKKRIILGFLFTGFLILTFSFALHSYFANLAAQREYETERADLKPPSQNIFTIQNGSKSRLRRYSAQIEPWMQAEVPAEQAGRVTKVLVEPGDLLEQGQIIVELDPKTAEINLRAAEARYAEAKRLMQEAEGLYESAVISKTDVEARRSQYEISLAERDASKQIYEQHFIRAPFRGVINERLVDIGDSVDRNRPVATLVDLEKLRVIFFVNDLDIHSFEKGQPVQLQIAGLPHLELSPSIEYLSRSADPKTKLFRLEAILQEMNHRLPGGLQGTVEAEVFRYQDIPFVPASAVRISGNQATVLKLGNIENSSEIKVIEVGPEIDGFYPVLSGLRAGDRVVIR